MEISQYFIKSYIPSNKHLQSISQGTHLLFINDYKDDFKPNESSGDDSISSGVEECEDESMSEEDDEEQSVSCFLERITKLLVYKVVC